MRNRLPSLSKTMPLPPPSALPLPVYSPERVVPSRWESLRIYDHDVRTSGEGHGSPDEQRIDQGGCVRGDHGSRGNSGGNVYVSLKLPARSGRNDLELVISLKDQAGKRKNTWSGTLSYRHVMNGDSYVVKDTLSLTDEHQDGEEISGTVKREETVGGIKTVWTLTPELTGDGQSLQGTLNVKKKHAQTQVWQAECALSVTAGADEEPASCGDAAQFAAALAGWLDGYRSGLSPADQRQLDHMLRSNAWLNGPAAEVP